MPIPLLPAKVPLMNRNGATALQWIGFFQGLLRLSPDEYTVATAPARQPKHEGYICWLSDYGHLVRWTGTVWAFAPGDQGNGFMIPFAFTPQQIYWGLCDGSTAYSYLVVGGATLTTGSVTPPNLADTYFRI